LRLRALWLSLSAVDQFHQRLQQAAQTVQKLLRWLQVIDMIKNSFCVDEYS
jgi:hypothetical protein